MSASVERHPESPRQSGGALSFGVRRFSAALVFLFGVSRNAQRRKSAALHSVAVCLFVFFVADSSSAAEPWSTYRGNTQRTGNTDNVAGPTAPKVLWVLKSQEHFIAAPLPFGDHVYVSGLGGFNVSTFSCLAADPKAAQR